MREFIAIAKALSDEHRVRALLALRRRELCLCQLVELLGLAPSTVSKHMTILKQAGLVEGTKRGRWMYYRSVGRKTPRLIRQSIDWAYASLTANSQVRQDVIRAKNILDCDAGVLCRRQREK